MSTVERENQVVLYVGGYSYRVNAHDGLLPRQRTPHALAIADLLALLPSQETVQKPDEGVRVLRCVRHAAGLQFHRFAASLPPKGHCFPAFAGLHSAQRKSGTGHSPCPREEHQFFFGLADLASKTLVGERRSFSFSTRALSPRYGYRHRAYRHINI